MVSKSLDEYKAIKGLSTDIFFRKGVMLNTFLGDISQLT